MDGIGEKGGGMKRPKFCGVRNDVSVLFLTRDLFVVGREEENEKRLLGCPRFGCLAYIMT